MFQEISSKSPGRVAVLSIVPAGSSITPDAPKYVRVIRFGRMLLTAATTLLSRLRNTASMGNFMPNVCIPLHGLISNPSPSSREFLPRRPFIRLKMLSAIASRLANTWCLVELIALILRCTRLDPRPPITLWGQIVKSAPTKVIDYGSGRNDYFLGIFT